MADTSYCMSDPCYFCEGSIREFSSPDRRIRWCSNCGTIDVVEHASDDVTLMPNLPSGRSDADVRRANEALFDLIRIFEEAHDVDVYFGATRRSNGILLERGCTIDRFPGLWDQIHRHHIRVLRRAT